MKQGYLLFFLFAFFRTTVVFAYNEERLDSLGHLNSVHSKHEQHSTFHYDLVRLIAIKAGFPPDSAELIARYSVLVDQINPQTGYPYPNGLTGTPLPDTFPDWIQSIAGTERTGPGVNKLGENSGTYWHFPLRNPADTTTGGMVYASDFPHPVGASYKGPPNFWRVPFSYYLDSIYNWAIHGTGRAGNPNGAPHDVYYFNADSGKYLLVPGGSIVALGILLHSIGDSYSHEECAVNDTIRSHPDLPVLCDAIYHHLELPYNQSNYSYPHIDKCAQAIWRALRAYILAKGYSYPALWLDGNGNNVPDELEETGDPAHNTTFIERWKAPETLDLNGDGMVNHYDHSARRIQLALNELTTDINDLSAGNNFSFDVFPNPASQNMNVRVYDLKQQMLWLLMDITGRVLMKEKSTQQDFQVDVSDLTNGVYFINVNGVSKKIMVQKY